MKTLVQDDSFRAYIHSLPLKLISTPSLRLTDFLWPCIVVFLLNSLVRNQSSTLSSLEWSVWSLFLFVALSFSSTPSHDLSTPVKRAWIKAWVYYLVHANLVFSFMRLYSTFNSFRFKYFYSCSGGDLHSYPCLCSGDFFSISFSFTVSWTHRDVHAGASQWIMIEPNSPWLPKSTQAPPSSASNTTNLLYSIATTVLLVQLILVAPRSSLPTKRFWSSQVRFSARKYHCLLRIQTWNGSLGPEALLPSPPLISSSLTTPPMCTPSSCCDWTTTRPKHQTKAEESVESCVAFMQRENCLTTNLYHTGFLLLSISISRDKELWTVRMERQRGK